MTAVCVLYSSFPDPHSRRARFALLLAGIHCELREVDPANLPTAVTRVPLLQLPSGKLIDDSFAIAQWASARKPQLGLWPAIRVRQQSIENLVNIIDGPFASACRLYAQAVAARHPHALNRRGDAEIFLAQLEARLARKPFLVGDEETLADIAVLPFIHWFAEIDRTWFDISPYRQLRAWLANYRDNPEWQQTLHCGPRWRPDVAPVFLDTGSNRAATA
ncbi:MAG TPA: glutathione S-transferase C-terminal domain-containing protein [Spongiibacteraceae bacterium]|nr:glutathione S-transferase C-terminal domain-containing protein [Spongiibacteraceae bacterium]